jgi:hypothetical protein
MNYCTLEAAYGSSFSPPGCKDGYGTKEAKREERKKAKKCKGPPMKFLEIKEKDPDRQSYEKTPLVPALNPVTGLKEHAPVDQNQGDIEAFEDGSSDALCELKNAIGIRNPCDQQTNMKLASSMPEFDDEEDAVRGEPKYTKKPVPSWFGAGGGSIDDDSFADYQPNAESYKLEPDFMKAFDAVGASKAGATDILQAPSVHDVWKPLTPSGTDTSYFSSLPKPSGMFFSSSSKPAPTSTAYSRTVDYQEISDYDKLSKKIDVMFAKLEALNARRDTCTGNTDKEVMLFISTGLFVMFMFDMAMRRK